MNSDEETRVQRGPGIAAYRGNGLNITMLCAKCKQPREQLGSKKLRVAGLKQAVCRQCIAAMGVPK